MTDDQQHERIHRTQRVTVTCQQRDGWVEAAAVNVTRLPLRTRCNGMSVGVAVGSEPDSLAVMIGPDTFDPVRIDQLPLVRSGIRIDIEDQPGWTRLRGLF